MYFQKPTGLKKIRKYIIEIRKEALTQSIHTILYIICRTLKKKHKNTLSSHS